MNPDLQDARIHAFSNSITLSLAKSVRWEQAGEMAQWDKGAYR